jgi:hypothetical protein
MGHRHQVQYRIGAAPQRHINGKGIPEGSPIYNITRAKIIRQKCHNLPPGLSGQPAPTGIDRRNGAVARQCHPHGLSQAVHRIGGKHPGTTTATGAGNLHQAFKFSLGHLTLGHLAHRLKDMAKVNMFTSKTPGQHGATTYKDGR